LAYDRLLQTKVRADLAVAHGYFDQVLQEVGSGTREVSESHALHRQLQRLTPRRGSAAAEPLLAWLEQERQRLGLDVLVLRPPHDPMVPPAQARGSAARLVVWEPAQVTALAAHLQPRLGIALVPTRNAAPTARTVEERALLMLASTPLPDDAPLPGWVLHGGLLLNRNLDFIDHINRIVYPEEALPFGSQGTATLFLDCPR
ncbi:MAG: two-component sensor histidine kinase, partial [Tepidimonas sp.]